jgi:hypothetical protein
LEKLQRHPRLVDPCLALLDSWIAADEQRSVLPYLEQWKEMLNGWSLTDMARVVLDECRGQPLRQCSPLGPVLNPRERWAVLAEVGRTNSGGQPRQP